MVTARRNLSACTDKTTASNANDMRIAAFLDKFEQRQTEHLQQLVITKNESSSST